MALLTVSTSLCWSPTIWADLYGSIDLSAADTNMGDTYYWPGPNTSPITPVEFEHNAQVYGNVNGMQQLVRIDATSARLTSNGGGLFAHIGTSAKATQSLPFGATAVFGNTPATAGGTMQFLQEYEVVDSMGLPWTGELRVLTLLNGNLVVAPASPNAELVARVRLGAETTGSTPDLTYFDDSAYYSGLAGTSDTNLAVFEYLYLPLTVDRGYGYVGWTLTTYATAEDGVAYAHFSDTLSVLEYQLADGSSLASQGLVLRDPSGLSVPEPITSALLGVGLLGVLLIRARRR